MPRDPNAVEKPTVRWWILLMLFLAIAINFLDRQVLSVVAPVLREQLSLSNEQYGTIVFCFMLGMTLGQVPVGMMLDRWGPRRGLPILLVGWSITSVLHAFARTVMQFSILRLVLGLHECGSYSAGVKVIGERFPEKERALAMGLFNSGCLVGSVLAPLLIVRLVLHFSWPVAFLVPGAIGCLWVLPWLRIYRQQANVTPAAAPVAAATPAGSDEPLATATVRQLLTLGPIWGVILIRAFSGPVSHFYWYWLPEYLKHGRGMSLEAIGWIAMLPYLCGGFGNIIGGWFSSQLIRSGWGALRARKVAISISCALCLLAMFVPMSGSPVVAVGLICFAAFGVNALSANHMALMADIFPQRTLARVSGMTGVGDGIMSMTVMYLTGVVVDHFSYLPVFLAVGLMPILALTALFVLVRRITPVQAAQPASAALAFH